MQKCLREKFSARAKVTLRAILCTRAILSARAIVYARANLTTTPLKYIVDSSSFSKNYFNSFDINVEKKIVL